jgi:MFS family permease
MRNEGGIAVLGRPYRTVACVTGHQDESDIADAAIDGDRPIRTGTARAALGSPLFRRVYTGALLSNIGTWMQNVTLAAFAFQLTGSETFVGLVVFAQLGPLLIFSLVGGALADAFDRRTLLIGVAVAQTALSLVLASIIGGADPNRLAILGVVFLIGVGQAIHAPTFTSVLPSLVRREDLAGAVSLQSANLNASRVIGPAIGGVVYATVGASWAMVGNAASYLFIIGVLLSVRFPSVAPSTESGLRRILGGFHVAARDRVVRRCLLTMVGFSFFCLPFVTQMAAVADRNFGIPPDSARYGLLYATFALGSLMGALSIGTFLSRRPLPRVARAGLVAFAVSLGAFAFLRSAALAYPVGLVIGFSYFATVTALSTVLQTRLADHERGRVMALWIMAFGGTVPIGGLVFGPVMEATSVSVVLAAGAVVALLLLPLADLRDRSDAL